MPLTVEQALIYDNSLFHKLQLFSYSSAVHNNEVTHEA